ncbi:MAG: hypothetical protein ABEK59_12025 [Halobacteria archaeon]
MSNEPKKALVVQLSDTEKDRLYDLCVQATQKEGEQLPVEQVLSALVAGLERGEVALVKAEDWYVSGNGSRPDLESENERLRRELEEQKALNRQLVRERCEETTLRVADKLLKVVKGLDILNVPVVPEQQSEWYLTQNHKTDRAPGSIQPILANLLALKEQNKLQGLSEQELLERVEANRDDDEVYDALEELSKELKALYEQITDETSDND